ncbi:MAG TPA: polysaccharide biosynthesis tyrosine autokinase [Terracidiphilus sp.]|nr:polysaccharide biosynthesis tyrosine autokinase [Terracidiphilus sp.]
MANTEIAMQPGIGSEGDSFGRLVQFLKKRGWIIAIGVCAGIGVAFFINKTAVRMYTATARIEIVSDKSDEFRISQVQTSGLSMDDAEKLDTETEILESRSLALQTINSLHLERNQDFVQFEPNHPWNLSDLQQREMLVGAFRGSVNVTRSGHTSILDINTVSRSPVLASLMANTLVDNYIERSFQDNFNSTNRISSWLSGELSGLKQNLQKSQNQMIDMQRELGIVGSDPKDSILVSSLEELTKELADAEVDRMVKEARMRSLKGVTPDTIDAAAYNDPALQMTKQQLAQLQTQYSSMAQTYGAEYPPLKALKIQIEQMERVHTQQENAEVQRVQKEYEAAKDNEDMLRSKLNAEEQDLFSHGQNAIQLEFARSEYEADRLLYDGLQQRLQEAGIMAGLHSSSIHIVDNADIPIFPSSPRTMFNYAACVAFGLIVSLAIALVLEAMDTNLKTMTDIEQMLQLPLLAAIPAVDTEDLLPSKFRESAVAKGSSSWSRIAESMRGMRTSILLSSPGSPPKVLLITSTRPAEGKSSVSTLMAITFALNGSRVLLIDSDLRRPSVHLRFRMGKGLGLSSVLSGKAKPKEAIMEWADLPNLHIMPSGPVPPLPSELLGSKQMEDMLAALRPEYDFILIDTPPVLAVTDAAILGRLVDASVLIIRYGTAQRQVVQRCIDLLDRSGTHLLGVVVNVVDFNAPEYSEYYGRKYYEYYGERTQE